jgi:4-amino-4-deoxy-L-arabinose transferase-like glycosyltransferase
MKKLVILIAGYSPLPIGYGINYLCINNIMWTKLTLDLISIFFFLCWGLLGFVFCKFVKTKMSALIICNLPAFIVLILILIQELINKKYWSNGWGIATQFYYLPTLRIGSFVTPDFMPYMWQTYIVSFTLMIIVFCLGCYIRDKINHNKKLNT